MLSNLHTHTTFCDGKSTAEETVIEAIKKGFTSLGFSGHGYTAFELGSCMKDEYGYIKEINRLKELYRDKIEIYLGTEEDAFAPIDRSKYEYIITDKIQVSSTNIVNFEDKIKYPDLFVTQCIYADYNKKLISDTNTKPAMATCEVPFDYFKAIISHYEI